MTRARKCFSLTSIGEEQVKRRHTFVRLFTFVTFLLMGTSGEADTIQTGGSLRPPCCFSLIHEDQYGGEPSDPPPPKVFPPFGFSSPKGLDLGPLDVPFTVQWLNSEGRILNPNRHVLSLSMSPLPGAKSAEDANRFRIEVRGGSQPKDVRMSLHSVEAKSDRTRDRLNIRTMEITKEGRVRTPWLVLVADKDARSAPCREDTSLLVALGDKVQVRVREGSKRSHLFEISVGPSRVDTSDSANQPLAVHEIETNFVVLSDRTNGVPLVGGNQSGLKAVIDHQRHVANQILAPCGVTISEGSLNRVKVTPPPTSGLLAVGERLGLLSKGGFVHIKVDGQKLGPWKIGALYSPHQTARLLSHNLSSSGFRVELSENPKTGRFAYPSADVVVRRKDNSLALIEPWEDEPLTSDPMQSIEIGSVNIDDGIDAYNDAIAPVGTLEERTLVKTLRDGTTNTVDIFIVNRFTSTDRQGESFIYKNWSPMSNAVILDVKALARARHAYTLSHELAHVLLNDLGHPDSQGMNDTSLLMHSRSSSAVSGPKRLTREECQIIRKNIEDFLR